MIVAVTGGTGFIGRRLVAALAGAGYRVSVLTRDPGGRHMIDGVQYIAGNLAVDGDLSHFLADAEVLFHCAGEIADHGLMDALHVRGTARLIEAASGKVHRWVQLSSTGAYGNRRDGEVGEGDEPNPLGAYEVTKTEADEMVRSASAHGAFAATILRPSIVYGADMPNQSLFAMLKMIERGWFFFIGAPGASANYVHVDNVVQALLKCGFSPQADGQVFNISDYCTMEQFVRLMAECLGVPVPAYRLPERPVRLAARILAGLPKWPLTASRVDALTSRVRYPTDKIERALQYRHQFSMAEGIADLVNDYKGRTS